MTEPHGHDTTPKLTNNSYVTENMQTPAQDYDCLGDSDSDSAQTLVEGSDIGPEEQLYRSLSPVPYNVTYQWERASQWEDDTESLYVERAESDTGRLMLLTSSDIQRSGPIFGNLDFDLLGIGSQFDNITLYEARNRIPLDDRALPEPQVHDNTNYSIRKEVSVELDSHVKAFNTFTLLIGTELSMNPEAVNTFNLLLGSKQSAVKEYEEMTDLEERFKNLSLCDGKSGDHYTDPDKQHPSAKDSKTNSQSVWLSSTGVDTSPSSGSNGTEATRNSTDSSDTPQCSSEEQRRKGSGFHPLSLLCWHAAQGIGCKGQVGRSPEVRRLLSDHSLCDRSNNHKLPPACPRCGVVYLEQEAARDHEVLFRSEASCPLLRDGCMMEHNAVVERIGISESKNEMIKTALATFRAKRKRREGQPPLLPNGCVPEHFRTWVQQNVPLYIGKSDTTREKAEKELSEWYIVFITLFPGETIPLNPFTEPTDSQHCRLLELIEGGLVHNARSGLLPWWNEQQHAIFREIFKAAVCTLQSELLQEESARKTKKSRGRSRKRKRSDNEIDSAKDSSSKPRMPLAPFPSTETAHGLLSCQVSKGSQPTAPFQTMAPFQDADILDTHTFESGTFEMQATESWDFNHLFDFNEPTSLNPCDI